MPCENKLKSSLILIPVIFFGLSVLAFGQESLEEKREKFQNRQRALNLVFYKNDIKALEDAPMRCFVRLQIVEFIYKNKIQEYSETAEELAGACLEEVYGKPEEFNSSLGYLQGQVIHLLRTNAPEILKKLEAKYEKSKDSSFADYLDMQTSEGRERLVERLLAKIGRGEIDLETTFLIRQMQVKDPESTVGLLDAVLRHFENAPLPTSRDTSLIILSSLYFEESVPVGLKQRFLRFVLRMGQAALSAENGSALFMHSLEIMQYALPYFKELMPGSFQEASIIYATLVNRSSADTRASLERSKRIEESENKLEQTIREAEAAENKDARGSLWHQAAQLAVREKKFRLAVDCILKFETSNEEFGPVIINRFLWQDILPETFKEKDFRAADYVIENIAAPVEKAAGLLQITSEYLELKNNTKASEKLNEALRVLDKAEDNIHKVRNMLQAVRLALKIENADAFEITTAAINVINKIPAISAEDADDPEKRREFLSRILMPNAYNLAETFAALAGKNTDLAQTLAQGIHRKDLRLAANITIETKKKYELPAEPEKKTQK
jgi:hypothetical protein